MGDRSSGELTGLLQERAVAVVSLLQTGGVQLKRKRNLPVNLLNCNFFCSILDLNQNTEHICYQNSIEIQLSTQIQNDIQ